MRRSTLPSKSLTSWRSSIQRASSTPTWTLIAFSWCTRRRMRCAFRICTIAHGRPRSCSRIPISVLRVKTTCRCMTPERETEATSHQSRCTLVMTWVESSWRKMDLSTNKLMTYKNSWFSNKIWSPNRSLSCVTFTQLVRSYSNCFLVERLLCKYLNSSPTIICMKPLLIQMSMRSPTSLRISSFQTTCVRFASSCCIRVQSIGSSRLVKWEKNSPSWWIISHRPQQF